MAQINCWTGDGKGKSTSAFGLVMRAYGQGLNILVMQFLKGENACEYGEIKTCKKLGIKVIQSGSNKIVLAKNKTDKDRNEAEDGFALLNSELNSNEYDLVIIDELLPVLQLDLLDFNMVYSWLKDHKKNSKFEIVITGRLYEKNKIRKIKDISDLYSKVVCINHPFNTKCRNCNIEFNFRYHYCPECGSELIAGKNAKLGIEY
jgi:cob(I)alamin adenosyltransferase